MEVNIEKLKDFNEVINYYKQMLYIAEDGGMTGIRIPRPPILNAAGPAHNRAIINNIGISIAQNFDIIERKVLSGEISEDIINLEILLELASNNQFSSLKSSLGKIMKENNLTSLQMLKQLRNSLLHGNYYLEYNDNGSDRGKIECYDYGDKDKSLVAFEANVVVHLKSKSMTGKIDLESIKQLEYFYDKIRDRYVDNNRVIYRANEKFFSCKNDYFLQSFIDSFKGYRIVHYKKENGNLREIKKQYPILDYTITQIFRDIGANYFEVNELSAEELKERKEFLKSYINYIGKNTWQIIPELDRYNQYLIIEDILHRNPLDNYSNVTGINTAFCETIEYAQIFDMYQKKFPTSLKNAFLRLTIESPIMYSNMLLGLVNYVGTYLKENNNDGDIPLFEYHNLTGFNGINILVDADSTKSIQTNLSGKEKQCRYDKYIENLRGQLKGLRSKVNKAKKNREKLNDKNPKKDELMREYNKIIDENSKKIESIVKKIKQIEKRKEEYDKNYTDYSEFFRHLRNSIAHGNCTIYYNNGLRKKDLSKIEYTFCDYPKGEHEIPEFKVKITAGKLIQIINGIQTRVNNQLINESRADQISDSYLDVARLFTKSQTNEEIENSKRPKETGLPADRIARGVNQVGCLEITTNEQIK